MPNPQEGETPAEKVTRLLTAKRIAHACDLTTNAVWKWKSQGGGMIPAQHQAAVLALAAELGVPLAAEEVIGSRRQAA